MESVHKLPAFPVKPELLHINLDQRSKGKPGGVCEAQQSVDPLEQVINREGLYGGALCILTPAKNLSQHCTLRYDAGCPGDAPLRFGSEVCLS